MTRARDIANFGDGIATADIGDGQITTAKIADGDVTSAKLFSGFANGITGFDQYRLFSNQSLGAGAQTITTGWERADTDIPGLIGSGVTESSGVFTFPDTGIWAIEFNAIYEKNGDTRQLESYIQVKQSSGGGHDLTSLSATFIQQTSSNETWANAFAKAVIDVTDTAINTVQFTIFDRDGSTDLIGNTTYNATYVSFTRLGDT